MHCILKRYLRQSLVVIIPQDYVAGFARKTCHIFSGFCNMNCIGNTIIDKAS
jgi:hypothetical protein